MRRLRYVLVPLAFLALVGVAQGQVVPPAGTSATLDVATWNLQFFGRVGAGPGNEALQFKNVLAVLRSGGIDVWGLQEVTDPPTFQRMLDSLSGAGYAGFLGPQVSADPMFDQRLAFVYHTSALTVQGTPTTILSGSPFGGRAPFEMRATVVLGDTSVAVRFIVLHAKAGATQSDYNQRVNGASALKGHIDPLLAAGEHVIVLGDFNDELGDSILPGTQVSPYVGFTTDPDYQFTTLPLDQANVATWCGSNTACTSGSTLDHVLITTAVLDDYHGESNRYAELLDVFDAFGGEFIGTPSDHLPVWARLSLGGAATPAEPGAPRRSIALLPPAPNPATGAVAFEYALDRSGRARLEVFDALGRRVATLVDGEAPAGAHVATLDSAGLMPGVYLVRLSAGGDAITQLLVRRR
jgi:endonuclease/exonuclease/phosphatase family metal-dependent hydrolase